MKRLTPGAGAIQPSNDIISVLFTTEYHIMNNGRSYRPWRLLPIVAMFLMAAITAFADAPAEPRDFQGVVQGDHNGKYIELSWYSIDSSAAPADSFYIYRAIQNNGQYTFTRVATVSDSNSHRFRFQFNLPVTAGGNHAYYVTGYNGDGEGAPSDTIYRSISLEDVTFTSPATTVIDSTSEQAAYSRDFDAVASNNGTVLYRLLYGPDGMTINSATGVVSWSVPVSNNTSYSYMVEAYLEADEAASATMFVYVMVAQNPLLRCAHIFGTVTADDSTNALVLSGTVNAVQVGGDSTSHTSVSAVITNGSYYLPVLPGIYKLQFYGAGYMSEWFEDANTMLEATAYAVSCDDSVIANFRVTPYNNPPRQYDSVAGTVRRASDNSPVMARVFIYGVYGDSTGNADSLLTVATTDSTGSYLAYVPGDIPLVALAHPIGADSSTLIYQYYNLSPIRTGADVFVAPDYGIDFLLEGWNNYENRISGNLTDEDSTSLLGTVTLYRLGEDNGQTTLTQAGNIYVFGSFSFQNLEPGDYILLGAATPDSNQSGTYAPGYYKENDLAVLTWEEATVISIDEDDDIDNADIRLQPEADSSGLNRLRGTISGATGRTRMGRGEMQSANPLAGALVYVLDAENRIYGSAITGAAGAFIIDGLPTGTFTVLVDKVGYRASHQTVTFTAEQIEQSIGTTLERHQSTSSAPEAPAARIAASIFPNPVTSALTLRFDGTAGTARITLATVNGGEVVSRTLEATEGENVVTIETSGLAGGTYFLTLRQGTAASSMPITIIR